MKHEDEQRIEKLGDALGRIHTKDVSILSYEEAYRHCYRIVINRQGKELYDKIKELTKSHIIDNIKHDLLNNIINDMLEKLVAEWEDHVLCTTLINDVCMYLNSSFLNRNNEVDLYGMSIDIFRENIIQDPIIQTHLVNIMLGMVLAERNGETINIPLMKSACDMLLCINNNNRELYETIFEANFLTQTQMFYKLEVQKLLEQGDGFLYISAVENRIAEEKQRVFRYLNPETEQYVLQIVETTMIKDSLPKIIELEKGLEYMLKHSKCEELKTIYNWFLKYNDVNVLMKNVSNYLRHEGRALVEIENVKSPINFIQDLISLKIKYEIFQKKCFQQNVEFERDIANDFGWFINLNGKSPEYLAKFINNILRNCEGDANIEEEFLEKPAWLFKCLNDKDIFERCYRVLLANRILEKKYISQDLEKSIISKIKAECGPEFTVKMESMIRDQNVFNDTMKAFEKYTQKDGITIKGLSFFIATIPSGSWPVPAPIPKCVLPSEVQIAFEQFKTFYFSQRKNEKVTLVLHPLKGGAQVKAFFNNHGKTKSKTYILELSTYQMCIIMLFNKKPKWTYEEIKCETNIEPIPLSSVLLSLLGQNKLLLRESVNADIIENSDIFQVNENFSSKSTRIKFPLKNVKNTSDLEQKQTLEKVDLDRKVFIDALIVRTMKTRNVLSHNELVTEVLKQASSRFKPKMELINAEIANCIEREYMKKAANKKGYEYIA